MELLTFPTDTHPAPRTSASGLVAIPYCFDTNMADDFSRGEEQNQNEYFAFIISKTVIENETEQLTL